MAAHPFDHRYVADAQSEDEPAGVQSFSDTRARRGDRYESMQDVVVDVLRHLLPALRPRQQLQPVREIAQSRDGRMRRDIAA